MYWACATVPRSRTAQWKKLGAIGIAAARRQRDQFAYQLKHGSLVAPKPKTVRQLSDEWFLRLDELRSAGELRPRTLDSYKRGIRLHVLPLWGSRDIRSIEPDDLVTWHERQRATSAAAWSIRARWMSVRGLFGYAARQGYILRNPCDALTRRERPKPGRPRARFLSDQELGALLGQPDQDAVVISGLLIFTGVRASELLGLTWAEVDFAEEMIRVRYQMSRQGERVRLKTEAAQRDVILMPSLSRLLRERKLTSRFAHDEDLVIANGVGRTLGYTRLRKIFARAANAAGIVTATPHTCRHTFASILIDQGRSVEFVSQQLGHSSTKTTWDIYVHLFRAREQADAARQELDAAFSHLLQPEAGQRIDQ